jgi:hypothetical protein
VDPPTTLLYGNAHSSLGNEWVEKGIIPERFINKKSPEERWREMSAKIMANVVPASDAYAGMFLAVSTCYRVLAPALTTRHCTGRSVQKPRAETVANAYRKLSSIITRNNVRRELRMAERHEKKGPKRRRLSSERWRRRFAHEVCRRQYLVSLYANIFFRSARRCSLSRPSVLGAVRDNFGLVVCKLL